MVNTPASPATSDLTARLSRLEVRMNDVFVAVERLAIRDAEFDASLRSISEHFSMALATQAEDFRKSLVALSATSTVQDGRKSCGISRLRNVLAYGRSKLLRQSC